MGNSEIQNILVVGSGVMGSSITQLIVMKGINVTLVDVDQEFLGRAMSRIESGLRTMVEFGMIDKDGITSILSRVTPATDLKGVAKDADFVIEAVSEIPKVKEEIFLQLGEVCSNDTVIASNTSGLNIFDLATIPYPEHLIIAHFFAPAHIIPLVEIVPGTETSTETISITVNLMERLGKKTAVMKKYGQGFIVNRIQKAIGEACFDMIGEGLVEPEEIDTAIKSSLGIRLPVIGVMQTFDFQGLDMLLDTMKNYGKVYPFIEERVKQGHLGAKTSRGIYDYGNRSEAEILKKRDMLFLKMLEYLNIIKAFDPV